MKFRFHRAAADQGPESVQARFACPRPRSKDEILQDGAQAGGRVGNRTAAWSARDSASWSGASGQPLRQNPLRRLPKINIPAGETGDQLSVGFSGEIHLRSARRVLIAQPVEPTFETVDAFRIARGILRAMIAIVPIQNVEASIRP